MAGPDTLDDPAIETIDGLPTRILRAGSARRTVVLIGPGLFNEGGVCWNLFAWERTVPALARSFGVVAFDTLAQGGSAAATGEGACSWDRAVAAASAVLDTIAGDDLHLVGHDHGALLVLHLARLHAGRVRSCTLVNATTVIAPPSEDIVTFFGDRLPAAVFAPAGQSWALEELSYGHAHIREGRFLADAIDTAQSEGFAQRQPSESRLHGELRPSLRAHRAAIYRLMSEGGLGISSLILWGNQNQMTEVGYGKALFDLIAPTHRETQFCVLNRCGYFPYREQPDAFNARVAGFIRSVT